MKNIFILTGLALLTFGCSVEKRIHNSGYHISKNSKSLVNKDKSQNTESKHTIVESRGNKETVAQEESKSNSNEIKHYSSDVIASTEQDNVFSFESRDILKLNETCDIIILKDGTEIKAKVLEINDDNIKYKMCDNLEGPTLTKNKGLIFMIKYPNGTSTVINSMESSAKNNEPIRAQTEEADKVIPSSAQWGLALSILGWFVPFGSILILTIGGLLGSHAIKKIKENPNKYRGEKMAKAAYIISLIGLIVWIIILLALILLYI